MRWTPPEAIHYRKFSEKSDVWSFGVLLWEVLSFGAQPYADWGNQQVLREVDKGYRMPCPEVRGRRGRIVHGCSEREVRGEGGVDKEVWWKWTGLHRIVAVIMSEDKRYA